MAKGESVGFCYRLQTFAALLRSVAANIAKLPELVHKEYCCAQSIAHHALNLRGALLHIAH
jgi:hypothetical protein